MTKAEYDAVFRSVLNDFKRLAPRKTGHLADDSIKGKWIGKDHYKIYIDANVLIREPNKLGEIAGYDYAYVINNEPSFRSYDWFGKNAYAIGMNIARKLGGQVRK